ncbi:glycoside hydrolase family 18 protein [Pedobacter gandavensis]|uniref:chitinase n=1 Tax=Pedobacter gandavensis TaxID=2679963 RepID=A0ABR6EU62_9SPHI|nr:glycoside hydrolase family 18 protein [Pedobacter gandavensis]MBB2148587.1 hypothetical protein [Pedobacter gandavensis]
MKKIVYILFPLMVLLGCKKNKNEVYSGTLQIFDQGLVFQSPIRVIQEGQSAAYNRLLFTPVPGLATKIRWTVDGKQVSTDTTFTFTPTTGGEFEVKLEATFNGQTETRLSRVLVNPSSYTPKLSSFVRMSYLSENGISAHVNWSNVSHVAFNGARVLANGSVDFSKGDLHQNVDELVARGHLNGIPVLLGVTGRLRGMEGWTFHGNTDFGRNISDVSQRAKLVKILAEYVRERKLDGIDVMMTDLSHELYDIPRKSVQSVGPFLSELRKALPTGSMITATVAIDYLHWEYTGMSTADWINVRAFNYENRVEPGAHPGNQSPLSYMIQGAELWQNKGFPANKIVMGVPAFGLRYLELIGEGVNATWKSSDYITYRDILLKDPTAAQKNFTAAEAKGVYYDGIPLTTQKANYIKEKGFKGVYLWAGDYDAVGENSMMKTISQILQ